MASSFLKRKAREQAEKINKQYGTAAYGGSSSLRSSASSSATNGGGNGNPVTKASDFLTRKAQERASAMDEQYGSGAYGGSAWTATDKEKGFQSWMQEVNDFSERMGSDYTTRSGSYQSADTMKKYQGDAENSIRVMQDRANIYRDYFSNNKDLYGEEGVNQVLYALDEGNEYLESLRGGLSSEYDFWSQFKDEDDYNTYQKWQRYQALPQAADYEEKSQYKTTKHGEAKFNAWTGTYTDTGYDDILYDYINGDEDAQSMQGLNDTGGSHNLYATTHSHYKDLPEETVKTFNYIYATEGKEAAYDYLDGMVERNYTGVEAIGYGALQGTGLASISALLGSGLSKLTGDEESGQRNQEWYGELLQDAASAQEQHPYAYGAGSVGGNLALMYSVGAGLGAAEGALATGVQIGGKTVAVQMAPAVQGIVNSSLSFLAADAAQNAGSAATGYMDAGEYLKSAGISGAQGLAGGLAGGLVGSGMAKVLKDTGMMTPFMEFVRQTTTGFASAGANIGTGYALRDEKPRNEQIATDLTTAFFFSVIQGGISTYNTTQANKAKMSAAYDQIVAEYNNLSQGWEQMTPEARVEAATRIGQFTQNLRTSLNSYYMAGQQSTVNSMNQALDAIETAMNQYVSGFSSAQASTVTSGNLLGAAASATYNQSDADLTAQVQEAVEQGLAVFHGSTGGNVGISTTDAVSGIIPAAAAQSGSGTDILARAAEEVTKKGRVTNNTAADILDNPSAMTTLAQEAGLDIREDMSKSQQRKAVKTAVEALASQRGGVSLEARETTPVATQTQQTATQAVTRTDAIMARDMQAVAQFGDTMGKAGATTLSAMYDPSVSAEVYLRGMNDYYNAGLGGTELEAVDSTAGTGLTVQQKEAAYLAGQADATNKTEVTSYGAEEGQVHLREGGQRADGADTGGELQELAGGTGENQSWAIESRPADDGAASLAYGEAVSTASLGIGGGASNDAVHLVVGGDSEATKAAKALAKERGLQLTLFGGNDLSIHQGGGTTASVRGYISGDRVFIRADHPEYTADQIMRHEAGHDMIANGELDPEQVRQHIEKAYGKGNTETLAGQYEAAYRGSNLTADEVWEEVVCDSLGDMNIFHDLPVLEDNAKELLDRTKAAVAAEIEVKRTRGAPVQTGAQGKESRDLEERRRALRKGEMVNEFRDKINWREYYQKIAQEEYNPEYYDDGSMAYMNLDGVMLTLEMRRNGEWSVIDMKEVSDYGDTGAERGRAKSSAKDGTEGLSGQREDDGHRSDLGGAGAVDEAGIASGQRGNRAGDGEKRAANHEADTRTERHKVKEKFSMEAPVEETKNLLAVHNKDEKSILEALKLGGLPMPSIAVVKAQEGHSQYGPISLVFDKTTIDPQADSRNKVYGSDAWTPTTPKVEYPVNGKRLMEIERELHTLAGSASVGGGIFGNGSALRSTGMDVNVSGKNTATVAKELAQTDTARAAYLANQGETLEPVKKDKVWDTLGNEALAELVDRAGAQGLAEMTVELETAGRIHDAGMETAREVILDAWVKKNQWRLNQKPELRETRIAKQREQLSDQRVEEFIRNAWEMYQDGGATEGETDYYATRDALREAVDDSAVEEWLSGKLDGLLGEPGIYNGKERYTPSGNSRSFSQLHYAYTLENIVKAMKETQKERGEGTWGITARTLQAVTTPEYSSIQAVKADSGRLGMVEGAEYDGLLKAMDEQIGNIITKIKQGNKARSGNSFTESDIIGEVLLDAAKGKKTVDAIMKAFAKEGYKISSQTAQDIQAVYKTAAEMPVGYFEAKPQRAVGFEEVLAAVIPSDSSEKLRTGLERAGVRTVEYEPGNEADRLEKVNGVEGARFSQDLEELDALRKENERLKGQVERWKGQLKRTTPATRSVRQDDVDKLARWLVKEYGGTLDASAVSGRLQALGDFLVRGGDEKNELTWPDVHEKALDIARDLVENAVVLNDEMYQQYSDLRDYLRTTKLVYGKEYHGDIADYNDFRKRNFGRLNLGSEGATNIDQVYQEMSSLWPEFFNEQAQSHPTDQLLHIVDVLDGLQPIYENPYSYDMAAATEYAAGEILDSLMGEEVRQTPPTYADRQAAKLDAAKAKGRQQVQRVRERANERLARQRAQSRVQRENAIARERQRRDERVQKLKDHYAQVRENKAARKADSNARTRLLHIAKRLQNKKLPAVNRALLEQYIGDLDTVSKGITGKTVEKLTDLQAWFNDRRENDPDFIADPGIERTLARLAKRHISDMTADEVADLTSVLLNIEHELRTEHKLIDEADRRDTYHLGEETIQNIYNTKGSSSVLDKFIVTETLSPVRQVRRMTGYVDSDPLYKLTQGLADGQRAMLDYQMKAERPFERFASDKAFSKTFSGPQAESIQISGLTHDGIKTVSIAPAMRVSLYLHSLNDQNLRHLKEGGITVPDEKLYRKGKLAEAYARGTTIKLTPSQVRAITSSMTEKEKAFARAAWKYFNETSKPSINGTSEKLKGYSLAQVDNYFPINTDSSFTKSEFETLKRDGTIEGMGFLKERQQKAANPILLRDANAVLEQAIRMHGKYVGLAVPVRNFNKVWNVSTGSYLDDGSRNSYEASVQQAIKQRWGETGYGYIEKLMTDLQGGSGQKNIWAKVLNKVRSNYAGAVLTLNLSVAMKQAASYPTAAAVLGWKPLARAMADFGKVDLARIEKYTPLQWYRSKGFSTKELGDLKTANRQLPAILNWVQGVDLLTTRKLWKASEYYVRQNNTELSIGTDAYWRAVADIYNRVIEETQPNYTAMQRPQLLRSDDTLMGNLAMFKTQPFQNFNIVYDAAGNWVAKAERAKHGGEQEKADAKNAKTDFGRAVTSQLAQLAVFAGMTMVWALLRGKSSKYEDDKGDMTLNSVLVALGKDMAGGALSGVPFGSDAWELMSSKLFGDTYYGMDAVTVTAVTDTLESLSDLSEQVKRIVENAATGAETNWNSERLKLDRELDNISKAAGVPYENIANLFKIVFRQTALASQGEYLGGYAYLKLTTDPAAYAKDYYDLLYKAQENDPEAYETIYADMVEQDLFATETTTTPKAIAGAMEERMKKAQGVKSVKDLERRYLSPGQEDVWDSLYRQVERSSVWQAATGEQRDDLEDDLYDLVAETDAGEKLQEKIDGGAAYGIDETDYLLYKLALSVVDEPNKSGNYGGQPTNAETEAAINMLTGLTDEARSYLWLAQGKSEKSNPWG